MLICILSDSHDNIPLLVAAVRQAQDLGAQAILHCGDLVAASTFDQLNGISIPMHLIHGNNTGDLFTSGGGGRHQRDHSGAGGSRNRQRCDLYRTYAKQDRCLQNKAQNGRAAQAEGRRRLACRARSLRLELLCVQFMCMSGGDRFATTLCTGWRRFA